MSEFVVSSELSVNVFRTAPHQLNASGTTGPLWAVREFDMKVLRMRYPRSKRTGPSEQAIRAAIRQAMLNLKLRIEQASKAEIRTLKEQGVLGKRAPSCTLLNSFDTLKLLKAFGRKRIALKFIAAVGTTYPHLSSLLDAEWNTPIPAHHRAVLEADFGSSDEEGEHSDGEGMGGVTVGFNSNAAKRRKSPTRGAPARSNNRRGGLTTLVHLSDDDSEGDDADLLAETDYSKKHRALSCRLRMMRAGRTLQIPSNGNTPNQSLPITPTSANSASSPSAASSSARSRAFTFSAEPSPCPSPSPSDLEMSNAVEGIRLQPFESPSHNTRRVPRFHNSDDEASDAENGSDNDEHGLYSDAESEDEAAAEEPVEADHEFFASVNEPHFRPKKLVLPSFRSVEPSRFVYNPEADCDNSDLKFFLQRVKQAEKEMEDLAAENAQREAQLLQEETQSQHFAANQLLQAVAMDTLHNDGQPAFQITLSPPTPPTMTITAPAAAATAAMDVRPAPLSLTHSVMHAHHPLSQPISILTAPPTSNAAQPQAQQQQLQQQELLRAQQQQQQQHQYQQQMNMNLMQQRQQQEVAQFQFHQFRPQPPQVAMVPALPGSAPFGHTHAVPAMATAANPLHIAARPLSPSIALAVAVPAQAVVGSASPSLPVQIAPVQQNEADVDMDHAMNDAPSEMSNEVSTTVAGTKRGEKKRLNHAAGSNGEHAEVSKKLKTVHQDPAPVTAITQSPTPLPTSGTQFASPGTQRHPQQTLSPDSAPIEFVDPSNASGSPMPALVSRSPSPQSQSDDASSSFASLQQTQRTIRQAPSSFASPITPRTTTLSACSNVQVGSAVSFDSLAATPLVSAAASPQSDSSRANSHFNFPQHGNRSSDSSSNSSESSNDASQSILQAEVAAAAAAAANASDKLHHFNPHVDVQLYQLHSLPQKHGASDGDPPALGKAVLPQVHESLFHSPMSVSPKLEAKLAQLQQQQLAALELEMRQIP